MKVKKNYESNLIKFCMSEQFKLPLGIRKTKKRELDTVALLVSYRSGKGI